MPSPAPGPRLPLEPADRPFYSAPGRIGCSGVAVVSVVAVVAFLFCLQVIAPRLTQRISEIELPSRPGWAWKPRRPPRRRPTPASAGCARPWPSPR